MFSASENIAPSVIIRSGLEQLALQLQLVLLSVVGTIGNALVLFVFGRTKEELVSAVFVMSLASVDFVTCSVVIPFTMYMEYVDFYVESDAACKFYEFLVTSPMQFSALVMVCIAVDRYVCICRPLATLFTATSAKAVVLSIGLVAAVLGLCPSLSYGVYAISRSVPIHLVYQLGAFGVYDQLPNTSLHHHHHQQEAVVADDGQENPRNVTAFEFDRLLNETSEDRDARILEFCRHLLSMIKADADSEQSSSSSSSSSSSFECPINTVVYTGHCQPTTVLISKSFRDHYRVCYHAVFVTCLLTAFVLYALTYRSVLRHRAGQQKRRSRCLETVVYGNNHHHHHQHHHHQQQQSNSKQQSNLNNSNSTDILKDEGGGGGGGGEGGGGGGERGGAESRRQSVAWCRDRVDSFFSDASRLSYARYRANAKTAAMLFVVTLMFAVSYLPALFVLWKTVTHAYDVNVLYLYFANNACNPIIYSFMNRNFRDNLKTTLKKLKRNHRRDHTSYYRN